MSDIIGFNHKYYQSFAVEFRQLSDEIALLLTVFTLPPACAFMLLWGFSWQNYHAEVMRAKHIDVFTICNASTTMCTTKNVLNIHFQCVFSTRVKNAIEIFHTLLVNFRAIKVCAKMVYIIQHLLVEFFTFFNEEQKMGEHIEMRFASSQ